MFHCHSIPSGAILTLISEAVSKLFAPHPAKRFESGDHYYLFVELNTAEEAQRSMDTLNGQLGPWGGPLRVNRARGPTQRPGERKEGEPVIA